MTPEQNRILLIVRANIRGLETWPHQNLDTVNRTKWEKEALEQLTNYFNGDIELGHLKATAREYIYRNWNIRRI